MASGGHIATSNTYYNVPNTNMIRGYKYCFIVSANNVIGEGDNSTLVLIIPLLSQTSTSYSTGLEASIVPTAGI